MATERSVTIKGPSLSWPVIVFIIFLLLKVYHVVAWSWWIVTLPLWILPALFVGAGVVALFIAFLVALERDMQHKRRAKKTRNTTKEALA